MSDYPPGTFGRAFDDFDAAVERLPWHFRWFWRRRARAARQGYEEAKHRGLMTVLRRIYEADVADDPRCKCSKGATCARCLGLTK